MRIGSLVMWTSQEDDGSYGSLGVITDIGDKSITVQWLNASRRFGKAQTQVAWKSLGSNRE